MNLVVVSNRVARGKPHEPMTGGLAAALLPVVENSGAIWVGSSGRVRDGLQKEPFAEIEALGAGALAMLDLPAAHYGGYYEGFANSALWPALHSRSDLIRTSQDDYTSYREVNAFMAKALLRFAKPETAFWVQDYHFLALGAELRELGITQPIGFFLHTPWPERAVIGGVPHHRELVEAERFERTLYVYARIDFFVLYGIGRAVQLQDRQGLRCSRGIGILRDTSFVYAFGKVSQPALENTALAGIYAGADEVFHPQQADPLYAAGRMQIMHGIYMRRLRACRGAMEGDASGIWPLGRVQPGGWGGDSTLTRGGSAVKCTAIILTKLWL